MGWVPDHSRALAARTSRDTRFRGRIHYGREGRTPCARPQTPGAPLHHVSAVSDSIESAARHGLCTFTSDGADPAKARLERIDAAIRRGDAQTAADVAAESERAAVHRDERALAARRPATRVVPVVRVERAPPRWVHALEEHHALREIRFHEGDPARLTDEMDDLERPCERIHSVPCCLAGPTSASEVTGWFAHPVWPIVVSYPRMLSCADGEYPGQFSAGNCRALTDILEADRYAMQRALDLFRFLKVAIKLLCFFTGLLKEH